MITAVIITRNEEKNILRAISSLTDPRVKEIIVADSNSKDKTKEIVERVGEKDERVRFVCYDTVPFTAARGRNEGLKICSKESDLILFLDGDMELQDGFLDEALSVLEKDEGLAAIAGQMHDYYYDDNCKLVKKKFNVYEVKKNKPGGAWLARALPLRQIGGYTDRLIVNEESELVYRLSLIGKRFKRIDSVMIVHHTELPISKQRIRERLFDKKVMALSLNLMHAVRNPGYFPVLFKENIYTMMAALSVLFSCVIFFISFYIGAALSIFLFFLHVVGVKSFRLAINYYVYAIGMILGFPYIFVCEGLGSFRGGNIKDVG